jgi:hypothetical protein
VFAAQAVGQRDGGRAQARPAADRKPDGKYRQDNVMRFVLAGTP